MNGTFLGRGSGAPRIMMYSHDSYGLGHLRRCLRIAERLSASDARPAVLIATGSPRAQAFDLPRGCDTLKLPAITKTPSGAYRARTLEASLSQVVSLRSELLRAAARTFRPDVFLVDHVAAGLGGELAPAFGDLLELPRPPRFVLGLRDVIDDVDRVRREWDASGAWRLIEEVYDRVLVYGDAALPTTAQELRLSANARAKLRFVGYLGIRSQRARRPRGELPMILVTGGGGGDGQAVMRAYCSYLESLGARARFRSVLLTGPFASGGRVRELHDRCEGLRQPIEIIRFTEEVDGLIERASGAVTMAGYNTVVELLSARVPALLVPRERPRKEQLIRAQRLSRISSFRYARADQCTPEVLAGFVERVLEGRRGGHRLSLQGLDRTAEELGKLCGTEFTVGQPWRSSGALAG